MKAEDLFLEGVWQVFSVRTGCFIGYLGLIEGDEEEGEDKEEEIKDPDQYELF